MKIEFWGDSLTKGEISAPIVPILKDYLKKQGLYLDIQNCGKNGRKYRDLPTSKLNKNSSAIIIIWLGTNDIWQGIDAEQALPILETLRKNWGNDVLIMGPPPIGEDPSHLVYSRWKNYCQKLQSICSDLNLNYLSLVDLFAQEIQSKSIIFKRYSLGGELGLVLFRRLLLKQDWNTISAKRGLRWHSDQIHLNEKAIDLIVEKKLGPFLQKALRQHLHPPFETILTFGGRVP